MLIYLETFKRTVHPRIETCISVSGTHQTVRPTKRAKTCKAAGGRKMESAFLNPQDKGSFYHLLLTFNVILIWLEIKSRLGKGGQRCSPVAQPKGREQGLCTVSQGHHSDSQVPRKVGQSLGHS